MITLRLRNNLTGAVIDMPANIWEEHSLTIGREKWEVLEPEQQYTPKPVGKAIRAAEVAPVAAPIEVEEPVVENKEPVVEVKPKKARRRK